MALVVYATLLIHDMTIKKTEVLCLTGSMFGDDLPITTLSFYTQCYNNDVSIDTV